METIDTITLDVTIIGMNKISRVSTILGGIRTGDGHMAIEGHIEGIVDPPYHREWARRTGKEIKVIMMMKVMIEVK